MKGPSSAGKSYTVGTALSLLPGSAYYALSSMSPKALVYSDEPLVHRHLVLYEATCLEGVSAPDPGRETIAGLVRSLLSEGHIRYETVDTTPQGPRARLVERPGPTGLIVTTTATRLEPELETRLLSLTVTDTPEQTARIIGALARKAAGDGPESPDLAPWHALQEWLALGDHRVVVPYAGELAARIPPIAVRLRRDFTAVLALVKAHAILHQASRDRDGDGLIVASIEDYAAVRNLVTDLVSDGVGATVPANVRETVEAVRALGGDVGMTITTLAGHLQLHRSAVQRRVAVALDHGYLRDLEARPGRGRPRRLAIGEEMPGDRPILPDPEAIEFVGPGGVL
ncbi:MAG: hypothetical protein FJZ01_28445 [Candidatus Sericytochromatia bacterium]|nr:hypothetical protein [Candidatus Tanganyikabacteria bacterium]